jgi:hypothetical protein
MNFQFYLEKLFNSKEFTKFKKENPSAFLCSGFFSIDKKESEKPDNQQHLDYFIPELNKMFSFKLDKKPVEMIAVENFGATEFSPEKIRDNIDFSFGDIEKDIENKMGEDKIKNRVEKLLWSLQSRKGKSFMIGTIFLSNLSMIKITFDLDDKKIIDFEKKSFFDFIRVIKKKD